MIKLLLILVLIPFQLSAIWLSYECESMQILNGDVVNQSESIVFNSNGAIGFLYNDIGKIIVKIIAKQVKYGNIYAILRIKTSIDSVFIGITEIEYQDYSDTLDIAGGMIELSYINDLGARALILDKIAINKLGNWSYVAQDTTFTISSNSKLKLEWDVNQENDLKNYHIYKGNQTRQYSRLDSTLETQYIESQLDTGRYFYAITARDSAGNESDYSKELIIRLWKESTISGDYNNDNKVNIFDLILFAQAFGYINHEIDLNGIDPVDIFDLIIFAQKFNP